MRFYTNFRDLSRLVDLLLDYPARGIVVLCIAVVICLVAVVVQLKCRR